MPKSLPENAQHVWRRVVPRLAKMGVLHEVDVDALADLCLCLARLRAAEAEIADRGLLVPGERGLVKNPACQLAREYRNAFLRWCQRFGLTPSDRERIEIPEPPKAVDPFDEFMRSKDARR